MDVIMEDLPEIDDLVEVYHSPEQICVFTGAGVSFTQDERYRAPEWKQLLFDIFIELLDESERHEAEAKFSGYKAAYKDAWDLASVVKSHASSEKEFYQALREAIIKENESLDSYGRLKEKNLRGATTLNAIISFCSKVRELGQHPRFEVNPKIKAVLTANYDFFLEAGATTKHQKGLFKPMSRPSSGLDPGDLPVYHIHGYLPFGKSNNAASKAEASSDAHLQPTEPLVLDRDSYEKAYLPDSWTRKTLDQFLCCYSTLFIGFSFEDQYLCRELERISKLPQAKTHYALLRRGDDRPSELLEEIGHARVQPILYDEHSQIPKILKDVYLSVFPDRKVSIPLAGGCEKQFDQKIIWDMLWDDKKWVETKDEVVN